jgi:hypothetical protein
MRYVFSAREPQPVERILLVESGSRHLIDRVVPVLREHWGNAAIDLVTCFPGVPRSLDDPANRVFRTEDFSGPQARARLYAELRARRYQVGAIICSGEPVMTRWKLALAWKVPAKFLAINENADYFWIDVAHRRVVARFAMARLGLSGAGGAGAAAASARLLLFPFHLAYLLLYAASAHGRRAVRRLARPIL